MKLKKLKIDHARLRQLTSGFSFYILFKSCLPIKFKQFNSLKKKKKNQFDLNSQVFGFGKKVKMGL